jgi:hypothetical protein
MAMNSVLHELLTNGAMVGKSGERITLHSQIRAEEGRQIQSVIATIKPKTTLEVGMAYAVSTLFICEALVAAGGKKHLVIDPYQNSLPDQPLENVATPAEGGYNGMGLLNVERAGYAAMVEFHGRPSYIALPQILETGCKIDYALIDGMHTFDYALVDFFYIDRLLNIGGVVTIDDLSFASVRKLCRYILTNRAYKIFKPETGRTDESPSFKRRLFEDILRWPAVGKSLKRWCKPELLNSDFRLGLPDKNYVSFQKTGDDTIMSEESEHYRKWNTHRAF